MTCPLMIQVWTNVKRKYSLYFESYVGTYYTLVFTLENTNLYDEKSRNLFSLMIFAKFRNIFIQNWEKTITL